MQIQEIYYLPNMKRSQLIEYGIIVTGLIFGYKFFESVFSLFVQIIFSFDTRGDISSFLVRYLPVLILYLIAFILLIRRSGPIAWWLTKDQSNENISVHIGKKPLLEILLICLAIATLLSNIADIVTYLFNSFRRDVARRPDLPFSDNTAEKMRFRVAAIETVASLIVLYYHRQVAGWFVKKNEANELIFESAEEKK